MEFKSYTAQDLKQLIESELFTIWKNIPISKHRALSQIVNPRAKQEDILLICAIENNELAGYLGLLPDDLYVKNNTEHLAWLSCIWLNTEFRGQRIAQKLIEKAREHWDENLLITGVVPQIEKIYFKSGVFDHAIELKGIKLFTGLDLQTWLPPKHPFFSKIKGLLKVLDSSLEYMSSQVYLDANVRKLKHLNRIQEIEIAAFDDELINFINNQSPRFHFQRGVKEWLWMLNSPWILEKRALEPRYYFTSVAKRFKHLAFKVTNAEGKMIAFMVLTIRDKSMKIPVLYGYDNAENELLQTIAKTIKQYEIASLLTFQVPLVRAVEQGKIKGFYEKSQTRKIFIGNAFDDKLFLNHQFQDGDGDLGFT